MLSTCVLVIFHIVRLSILRGGICSFILAGWLVVLSSNPLAVCSFSRPSVVATMTSVILLLLLKCWFIVFECLDRYYVIQVPANPGPPCTYDMMPIPSQSYQKVHAELQTKFNTYLAVSLTLLTASIASVSCKNTLCIVQYIILSWSCWIDLWLVIAGGLFELVDLRGAPASSLVARAQVRHDLSQICPTTDSLERCILATFVFMLTSWTPSVSPDCVALLLRFR